MIHRAENNSHARRAGLTLAEMLVSIAVMGIMAAALSTLAATVQMANEYATDQGIITQHARVIIERMERNISLAHSSRTFPGVLAIPYRSGSDYFPQALVIWEPEDDPSDPDGAPVLGELIIYAADPDSPNRLLEITHRDSSTTVPGTTAYAAWRTMISNCIASNDTKVTELTNMIKAGSTDGGSTYFSSLRFEVQHSPSDAEFTAYDGGTMNWEDLSWALGISGSNSGLRQTWCRYEFQMMPISDVTQHSSRGEEAVPYFGSAAVYYQVDK